jgi:putative membrane protein
MTGVSRRYYAKHIERKTEKRESYVITLERHNYYLIPLNMMYGYYDYSPFHMFGSLFMVLFWIVLFFLLFKFLARDSGHWRGRHDGGHSGSRATEILKERYAKGEITKEQFEEMRKEVG